MEGENFFSFFFEYLSGVGALSFIWRRRGGQVSHIRYLVFLRPTLSLASESLLTIVLSIAMRFSLLLFSRFLYSCLLFARLSYILTKDDRRAYLSPLRGKELTMRRREWYPKQQTSFRAASTAYMSICSLAFSSCLFEVFSLGKDRSEGYRYNYDR